MTDQTSGRLVALRGATTVAADTSDDIKDRTAELLRELLQRNRVAVDDIVSVMFTTTPDLHSDFPAVAARSIGLSRTPLLCAQEIAVEGAMERCVRVLIHAYLPVDARVRHAYLHDARQLRLDLPE